MPAKRPKPQHRVTKRAPQRTSTTGKAVPEPQTMANTSSNSPVYFYRPTEPSGYLSQWYPCAFSDDKDPSIIYPTAEHYMMYHKALLFSDPAVGAEILAASHPSEVKALGRKVSNFTDTKWHAHREEIVRKGNVLKFTRPVDVNDGKWIVPVEREDGVTEEVSLRTLLLRTGERELVEASPRDRIWGIGYGAANAGKVGRAKWGLNLLGKALMAVREELKKELEQEEERRKGVVEEKTEVTKDAKVGGTQA